MRKSQQGLCCVHCVHGTFNQHRSLQRRQPRQYQVPMQAPTKAVYLVSRVLPRRPNLISPKSLVRGSMWRNM